jgi:hypothetical protein
LCCVNFKGRSAFDDHPLKRLTNRIGLRLSALRHLLSAFVLFGHGHQLNAAQDPSGRNKVLKSEHWSDNPLDGPVILFDDIVQIFDLANFDGWAGLFLNRFQGRQVRSAFVDRYLFRPTV